MAEKNVFSTCHKFGGTSVASATCYKKVAEIIQQDKNEKGGRLGVVVSAMSKVTDHLIKCLNLARDNQDYASCLEECIARHRSTARELLGDKVAESFIPVVEKDTKDVLDILRAVQLTKLYSERILELVSGFGEVWSAQLLAAYLRLIGLSSTWLDARNVLVVEDGESGPIIKWTESAARIKEFLKHNVVDYLVITGYVACTAEGIPCTLKRNGSDFSGSIFGSLLNSASIIIWTDVDGVFSADPRKVPEAVMLDEMSYNEAAELAYFGAKVLHPHTMAPAIYKNIPIYIRNTFNSTCKGTKIFDPKLSEGSHTVDDFTVKGFSTMDGVALVNVEGTGMIGVPGIAQRVFGAVREVGISVIMIAQSSSEHSICFAVLEDSGAKAKQILEKAFFREMQFGLIQTVDLITDCSILTVVGDAMARVPGVAAKFFGALGRARVNVVAIAQGSSERNITTVIQRKDSARALRAAHSRLLLPDCVLAVGVIGTGVVGGEFLDQLQEQLPVLRQGRTLEVKVVGIADWQQMILSERDILSNGPWRASFNEKPLPIDLTAFAEHVTSIGNVIGHSVIVDCTANQKVADSYADWLSRRISIITPNKKAFSSSIDSYRELSRLRRKFHVHVLNECTVGAALPVIGTLRDLVLNGDKVHRIEGVLSGTLSYIFNVFSPGAPSSGPLPKFSDIVREAKAKGYTEPDARDDLSGTDVARKVCILARECGLTVELSDLNVLSLVPDEFRDASKVTADQFLAGLDKYDAEMAKQLTEARDQGEVLRYVGVVDVQNRKASVELRRYPLSHPLATLADADNMIAFTTARYCTRPLVIRGPGAGAAVTAGGVFADLLKLAICYGAILP